MQLGLSTVYARSGRRAPDELVDVLLRSGAEGLELDASLDGGLLAELLPRLAARRDELPVLAVENVCPGRTGRAAELASLDRSESDAAVSAAVATIRLATECGAAFVALSLGEVAAARTCWPDVRRAFLRAELDADSDVRARLVDLRAAGAARHLDALRRTLDRLSRVADAGGVMLAIRNPARHIGLPDALELRLLFDELRGAPLAPCLDAPAAHLADAMGLVPLADTLLAWKGAPLSHLADACAQVAGLPPGRGELDLTPVIAALAPDAVAIFTPSPILDETELHLGVSALNALIAASRQESDAARA